MNDRRSLKTEKIIKDTFMELLKKNDLSRITVAEISRKANLGRGTFYLHYSDVYDLYEQIENEIINNLINAFKFSFPTTNAKNSEKLTEKLICYIEENRELFKLITHSNNCDTMYKIKKSFYLEVYKEDNKINPNSNKEYNLIESIFVVSGIIGVIEKWIKDDFSISTKEMSSMINKILIKVNNN